MPNIKNLTLLALITFCCISTTAYATDHDSQIWTTVNLNTAITDRISTNLELQARFTEDASVYGQQFVRPSVTYQLNDVFSLTAGYVHVLTNTSKNISFRENRPWQQVGYHLFKNEYGTTLDGRTRLEQRFIEGGDDTGWRIRQQLRFETPLQEKGRVKLLLWNETFYSFNDTDWGQRDDLDQIRNFIGVTLPVFAKTSLDAGYLNQAIFRTGEDRMNHALATTLTIRF